MTELPYIMASLDIQDNSNIERNMPGQLNDENQANKFSYFNQIACTNGEPTSSSSSSFTSSSADTVLLRRELMNVTFPNSNSFHSNLHYLKCVDNSDECFENVETTLPLIIEENEDLPNIKSNDRANRMKLKLAKFSESVFRNSLQKAMLDQVSTPRITRSVSRNSLDIPEVNSLNTSTENRRCVKRPLKRLNSDFRIMQLYLNKQTKFARKNLETIYEDPVSKDGNLVYTGNSKIKRSLYLNREFRIATKSKLKHRKTKIKRLMSSKDKRMLKSKISEEEFKSRMKNLESFLNSN